MRNEAPPPPPNNDIAALQAGNIQLLCNVVNLGNGVDGNQPPPPPPAPTGGPPPPAGNAAEFAINVGQNNIQLQCQAVNNGNVNNNQQQCIDAVQQAIQALAQVAAVLQQIQDANLNQQAMAAFHESDAGMQAIMQAQNAGQAASQDSLNQVQAGFQILQQLFGGGNK